MIEGSEGDIFKSRSHSMAAAFLGSPEDMAVRAAGRVPPCTAFLPGTLGAIKPLTST